MVGRWFRHVGVAIGVAALAACGGGGGGGSSTGSGGTPSTDGRVSIQGTATFDSVPTAANGSLDYSAVSAKPIRGATVELIAVDGQVVASGTTSDSGGYALSVAVGTTVSLRVRAQMQRSGSPAWDVTVRDNTASGAIYAIGSTAFSSGSSAVLQRDIHAASGWTGSSYGSTRTAGPFALLDTVYTNTQKVLSVAPSTSFPALNVYWSVNNAAFSGDPALGQIGTTFFSAASNGDRSIYVLGQANADTDEYDASVISHEWGHYYQSAFSRDDSPGGSHGQNDLLDRRLAFSEGWGNAWSGIVLGRSTYADSYDTAQARGLLVDLSTGPTTNPGWFRERSIQSILWNLERAAGFGAIHATLTGSFKTGLAVTSIHPFAAAFAVAAPSQAGTLASLLSGQSISSSTSQPFGDSEANSGGVAVALPLYQTNLASVCVAAPSGGGNKLGRFAYVRFYLASAGAHRITVTGSGGTDPAYEVYQGGWIARSNQTTTSLEDATLNLPAGESVLVLQDANATATCFAVSIT